MNGLKWLEIAISVIPEDIEAVCNVYNESGTGGVVIEDPAIIYNTIAQGSSETVAIQNLPRYGSLPVIKGYLFRDEKFSARLNELRENLAKINVNYSKDIIVSEIEESSWSEKWKEFYKPFKLGHKFLIKPTWLPNEEAQGLKVIEMDPGMAFGCGTHATTAMCVELLEEIIVADKTVVDVGTGSGILSIVSAMLGAREVQAVDLDPVAVRVARDNIAANGLDRLISVGEGNLLEGFTGKVDIVVANIIADVIKKLLPSVLLLLSEGGCFIASGIIKSRSQEVAQAIREHGLDVIKTSTQGEWIAFLAQKNYG